MTSIKMSTLFLVSKGDIAIIVVSFFSSEQGSFWGNKNVSVQEDGRKSIGKLTCHIKIYQGN